MAKVANFTTYKEQVLTVVKSLIIAKKISPGEILNERKLAYELSISRTPVREAIQDLENEGWVKVFPWKGAIVQTIALSDVRECFQLRQAIEPMVIELVAKNLKREDFNILENILKEQKVLAEESDADSFIVKDQEFHLYLAYLTGNNRLYKVLAQLEYAHRRIGVEIVQNKQRYKESIQEHEDLLTLLKERKILAARDSMLNHLVKSEKSIVKALEDIEK